MTVLQWGLVLYGGLMVFGAIALDGKPKQSSVNSGTIILINLAIFQWLMWYAGAWN